MRNFGVRGRQKTDNNICVQKRVSCNWCDFSTSVHMSRRLYYATFMYTTHISMCTYSTVQAAPCNRDIGKVKSPYL